MLLYERFCDDCAMPSCYFRCGDHPAVLLRKQRFRVMHDALTDHIPSVHAR